MRILRWTLIAALAALLAAGCAKKPAPAPEAMEEAPVVTEMPSEEVTGIGEGAMTETGIEEGMAGAVAPEVAEIEALERIHFGFDQYTLSVQARETLASNAAYLQANPDVRIRIEGHCDDRGAEEYNLALGERRALAAKNYLVSLGVASDRLSIISFGEEMPLDAAGTEEAWAKNRRADFKEIR